MPRHSTVQQEKLKEASSETETLTQQLAEVKNELEDKRNQLRIKEYDVGKLEGEWRGRVAEAESLMERRVAEGTAENERRMKELVGESVGGMEGLVGESGCGAKNGLSKIHPEFLTSFSSTEPDSR